MPKKKEVSRRLFSKIERIVEICSKRSVSGMDNLVDLIVKGNYVEFTYFYDVGRTKLASRETIERTIDKCRRLGLLNDDCSLKSEIRAKLNNSITMATILQSRIKTSLREEFEISLDSDVLPAIRELLTDLELTTVDNIHGKLEDHKKRMPLYVLRDYLNLLADSEDHNIDVFRSKLIIDKKAISV